jgi:predicted RNase H-like HicB family nuclease
MLQRRAGETLQELLERLDAAIDLAWTTDQYTDEINPPLPPAKQR